MEVEDLDNFSEIPLNSDSFDSNGFLGKPCTKRYRPSPKRLLPALRPVDFETYVETNCQEKIQILNRTTFHRIKKPIIIFFNHFREKCAYHIKCLDKMYQLSLKYGDRIKFIAADILDIDVMNSKWCSISLFCCFGNPEKVSALIYAIDDQKRIHEHLSSEKSHESLINLCENLLKGSLFITQQLPEPNNRSLVKICVHQNYNQLVTYSSKHILLIVNLEDYSESSNNNELNYETIAEQLNSYNVDVIHINAEQNYVPFELDITCYPSFLFMPKDDQTNYVEHLEGPHTQENIINRITSYFQNPKLYLEKSKLESRKKCYQPLNLSTDFQIDFYDLQQYLEKNCNNYLKMFERQAFLRTNCFIIIAFFDFQDGKCLAHHMKWIDKIYQVAINLSSPREYFVADLKDIDIINPLWTASDFKNSTQAELMIPKVFGIDLNKNKFVLKDFRNAASLFYFAYSLTNGELYISEPWPNMNEDKLVKTCIADSLNLSITSMKKDIFLAIYYSNAEHSQEFLQLLDQIALELKMFPLKLMKIDSRLNCLPLELDNSMYPLMYFIPQSDKSKRIRFSTNNFCKKEIVDFISQNIQEYKLKL